MKRLTKRQVLLLHSALIDEFGGLQGVRDEGLLDSAINSPFQTFAGAELYPTLFDKAARLCFALVRNHPFIDGNKRIGAHCMLVLLSLNGEELIFSDQELIDIILSVADGSGDDKNLIEWLLAHRQ